MNSATRLNMTFFISAARSRTPPTKKLFAFGEKDESGVFDFFDKLPMPWLMRGSNRLSKKPLRRVFSTINEERCRRCGGSIGNGRQK